MKTFVILLVLSFSLLSCKEVESESTPEAKINEEVVLKNDVSSLEEIIASAEKAHNKNKFSNHEAIYFDIIIEFGEKERLNARIAMTTDSKLIRMNLKNGKVVTFDGENVWSNMAQSKDRQARFDIFTWSYFFMLPHKISDSGTNLELKKSTDEFDKVRLSFDQGIGDSPDDWYDLYFNKDNHRLEYAGYIVTFGGIDKSSASKDAHAISYENYTTFQEIPVSLQWNFYNYEDSISKNERIGKALISDVEFGKIDVTSFELDEGMHLVSLPSESND